MSYPNISMNSVLNCIYAESEGDHFQKARSIADSLYWFARGHGYVSLYESYIQFVLSFLNALTGDESVSSECQSAVNFYFAASNIDKYDSAPSACIADIRAGTEQLTAEYNADLEKTAETRRILSRSVPICFSRAENTLVADYIKYVNSYEPEYSETMFYGSLYKIGFMQGIRSERARRNGTLIHSK